MSFMFSLMRMAAHSDCDCRKLSCNHMYAYPQRDDATWRTTLEEGSIEEANSAQTILHAVVTTLVTSGYSYRPRYLRSMIICVVSGNQEGIPKSHCVGSPD